MSFTDIAGTTLLVVFILLYTQLELGTADVTQDADTTSRHLGCHVDAKTEYMRRMLCHAL